MDWTDTELIELYDERCAIREYDGGLPRREAEQAAYWDLRALVGRQIPMPDEIRQRADKWSKWPE